MSYDAGQNALTDIDAARAYVDGVVAAGADTYGWTTAQLDRARADIAAAYEDADDASWWGYDVPTFYGSLADRAEAWDVPNEDALQAAWASAAGTSYRLDEATSFGTYAGYAYEAATDTAEDFAELVEQAGDAAGDVAKMAGTPWPYIGGALAAAALLAVYL